MSDPVSGDGTMQLTLDERSPGTLTGTWSATFRSGGRVSGAAVGTLLRPGAYGISLYADPPPCATGPGDQTGLLGYTLVNTAVTSTRLTAVLGRTSCSGIRFGAVDLVRQ